MLFAKAHKEAKAGMKAHMAKERKLHNDQLRKAQARKQLQATRGEVAASR